jgi:DNA polymerase-1
MATLMLLDGNSLTYRAFHALPTDMATASGQVTNAVFGFTSMLINLLKDHKPDGLAVAWDRPEPTFRHEMVKDYKAGRAETPDILRQQFGLVRQVIEVLHVPLLEIVGYEADDVIATLATRARDRGDDVIVVTGDRDAYQLVEDPHIRVLYNRRGVSDYALYDEAGIKERTGVTPVDYPLYASLRGDPSDNLPGVPGVGEKTAAKLVNTYGDVEGIYANVDKNTPKLRQSLIDNEAQVRSNLLATPLVRDVPIDADLDELKMGGWDPEEVRQLFQFLEFRSLLGRLQDAVGGLEQETEQAPETEAMEVEVVHAATPRAAADALAALHMGGDPVGMVPAWEGREGRSAIAGLAFAAAGSDTATWIPGDLLGDAAVIAALQTLVGPSGVPIGAHHAKPLLRALAPFGIDVCTLDVDTAVASYLLDPARDSYPLDEVAARYAGLEIRSPDAPPPGELDLLGTAKPPGDTEARSAVAVGRLVAPLRAALEARGLTKLYDEIERPLVRVLARMEVHGVRVDVDRLRSIVLALTEEAKQREQAIQELAGHPFTVNSTPQLRTVLFDELGLQPSKKTKTGYSTDAASLEKLKGQHQIIDELLRYREVEKLRSTYGESFLNEVQPDGRIHATFQQTVARTGRLSSEEPNLHNIPVRSDEGRRFREAFLPAEGWRLLVADYNQIELRVIAHLAKDPGLIEAFTSGTDIHTATASRVFSVEPADVTIAQRSKAKMVSYGLAYGMESFGLAARLGIPKEEAAGLRAAYFEAFPAVEQYMEQVVAEARSKGYTETLFGRRRLLPELAGGNFQTRLAAERQAMNAPIQGLAADIFKVALVKLEAALDEAGLRSRIVLQVHDEVILEVPPEEEAVVERLTLDAMHDAADLDVPLEVNLSWGDTWATAKS